MTETTLTHRPGTFRARECPECHTSDALFESIELRVNKAAYNDLPDIETNTAIYCNACGTWSFKTACEEAWRHSRYDESEKKRKAVSTS